MVKRGDAPPGFRHVKPYPLLIGDGLPCAGTSCPPRAHITILGLGHGLGADTGAHQLQVLAAHETANTPN